jgi:hypothetical protein
MPMVVHADAGCIGTTTMNNACLLCELQQRIWVASVISARCCRWVVVGVEELCVSIGAG